VHVQGEWFVDKQYGWGSLWDYCYRLSVVVRYLFRFQRKFFYRVSVFLYPLFRYFLYLCGVKSIKYVK